MKSHHANFEPDLQSAGEAAPAGCCLPPSGLTARLLGAADLPELIHQFGVQSRSFVSLDGIEYVNDEHAIVLKDGIPGRHRARYTLRMREITLGHITFTRSRRFERAELTSIELLLVELLLPLLAILHRRALAASARGAQRPAASTRVEARHPPAERVPTPPTGAPSDLALLPLDAGPCWPDSEPTLVRPLPHRGDDRRESVRRAALGTGGADGER